MKNLKARGQFTELVSSRDKPQTQVTLPYPAQSAVPHTVKGRMLELWTQMLKPSAVDMSGKTQWKHQYDMEYLEIGDIMHRDYDNRN